MGGNLVLFNTLGQKVAEWSEPYIVTLDLGYLPKGAYLLVATPTGQAGRVLKKIVLE